jgi:hypothetical protein
MHDVLQGYESTVGIGVVVGRGVADVVDVADVAVVE